MNELMDITEIIALFSALVAFCGTLISFENLKLAGWSFLKTGH